MAVLISAWVRRVQGSAVPPAGVVVAPPPAVVAAGALVGVPPEPPQAATANIETTTAAISFEACTTTPLRWVRIGANGVVGDTGLEPVTSCMSSKCSNQLS